METMTKRKGCDYMASAKQLASGSWRVQAKKTVDGKTIVRSFTVSPKDCAGDWRKAKKQAEHLASEWVLSVDAHIHNGRTVKEACEVYIQDRSNILSPSTFREYSKTIQYFESINNLYISDISTEIIQRLINDMKKNVKKKTIKNRISFLLSALDYSGIDRKFKISYPENDSKTVISPDIDDLRRYIEIASEEYKPIIYLAAFGSLRRGEIHGLKEKDVSRDMNMITISGNLVKGSNGWVYKPPKTEGSARSIVLPKFVIDALPKRANPDDYIFDSVPSTTTDRFVDLSHKLNLPFNFHSLRHFAASFRSDLGIPKKYIQEVGGWVEGDGGVLDRIYDNKLDSSRRKYTQIANNFIEENFNIKKTS